MVPLPFAILHGGAGAEVTLVEYLLRLLVHLLAFGVVAALVYAGSGLLASLRSAVGADRADESTRR